MQDRRGPAAVSEDETETTPRPRNAARLEGLGGGRFASQKTRLGSVQDRKTSRKTLLHSCQHQAIAATRCGLIALCALSATAATAAVVRTQSSFATKVHAYLPGPGVGVGFDDPTKALGPPNGAGRTSGSLDVVSLGASGSLTIGFDRPLTNGPGADFIVFENAFIVGLEIECYAEVAFVEVSSNGVDFARFETSYVGPATAIGPYGALLPGTWGGVAGTTPTLANPTTHPEIDPRDPARAGGDAFDLEALRAHPLALRGRLNIYRVTHVRIVDIEDGKERDRNGRLIRDPSLGSADIEAVCGLHFFGTNISDHPSIALSLDAGRRIRIEIADPRGLATLDLRRLHFSAQGDEVDTWGLISLCRVVQADATRVSLESNFAVPIGMALVLAASTRDSQGKLSAATLHLH